MPSNSWLNDWVTGDIVPAAEYRKSLGAIYDSTLGGAAATIDFTPIPTTYAHLLVELYARGDTAATSATVSVRMNNDSGANYNFEQLLSNNATVTGGGTAAATSLNLGNIPAASAPANEFGAVWLKIPNYGGATNFKALTGESWWETADTAAGQNLMLFGGVWKSASAITRLTFILGAGNFAAGSRATVYVAGS